MKGVIILDENFVPVFTKRGKKRARRRLQQLIQRLTSNS